MKIHDDVKQQIIDFFKLYYSKVWENADSPFLTIKPIMIITLQDIASKFEINLDDIKMMRDVDKEFDNKVQNFINTNLLHYYSSNKFKEGIIDYARVWSKLPDDAFAADDDQSFYDHSKWATKLENVVTVNHDVETDQESDYFKIEKL